MATVEAHTKLVCLTLARDTFTELLGPLERLMEREKSPQVRGARVWVGMWVWRVCGCARAHDASASAAGLLDQEHGAWLTHVRIPPPM